MTLELAARTSKTPTEVRASKGVGDKRAADLGPAFLECIAAGAGWSECGRCTRAESIRES